GDAATVYFTTVRADPTNLAALLGLERTLYILNRMPELLPLVQNARARLPESSALRSLELRVYAALNQLDSLEAIARRWAARAAPGRGAPPHLGTAARRMVCDRADTGPGRQRCAGGVAALRRPRRIADLARGPPRARPRADALGRLGAVVGRRARARRGGARAARRGRQDRRT